VQVVQDTAATVPAWLVVVLPIATLLIGAAVPIITQRLQSAEDRRAREEIRNDARRDRQRAELLKLQDALTEAQRVFAAAASDRLDGKKPPPSAELIGARGRVEAKLARVEDDEARSLGRDFADRAMKMLEVSNREEFSSLGLELGRR